MRTMPSLTLTDLDERVAELTRNIQALLRELGALHAELREVRSIRAVMLDKLEAEVMGWTNPQMAAAISEGRRKKRCRQSRVATT